MKSNSQKLIERLRCFEADHGPDGWPAVRMRDISAVLDALEVQTTAANHWMKEANKSHNLAVHAHSKTAFDCVSDALNKTAKERAAAQAELARLTEINSDALSNLNEITDAKNAEIERLTDENLELKDIITAYDRDLEKFRNECIKAGIGEDRSPEAAVNFLAFKGYKARARLTELKQQEPVGYMSAKQLSTIKDGHPDGGVYIPLRKTPEGNFTTPLYVAPGGAVFAEQEPVITIEVIDPDGRDSKDWGIIGSNGFYDLPYGVHKLYTAPQPSQTPELYSNRGIICVGPNKWEYIVAKEQDNGTQHKEFK